jgi:hypothetical protein
MATARTKNCSFELHDVGIVIARVDHGMDMDVEDARQAVALTHEVAGQRRVPVLVDLRGIRSQTRAAREYLSSSEIQPKFAAVALLIASPVAQVIGNFFMRLRQQPVPTRLFDEERKAIEWLAGFR